ncbi:hypothetical protein SCOR_19040 [Sulfidibacter corallicola]|uniref:Uncharacterized protein n=1 Tax=Sulfidibacter corallicola TaxID=2818388 RepID=A0A8A4U3X9_SULCO|nr:hypothetical protein [Sulfidibacter corallicola]QTD53455.1 hypothetical protein J3U87_13455 [Sulfidibacter corallicola]
MRSVVYLGIISLFATTVWGQETVGDLQDEVWKEIASEIENQDIKKPADHNAAKTNSGALPFGDRVATTINDFLPTLSGFVETTPAEDGTSATIRYNLGHYKIPFKFAAATTVLEPSLFAPMLAAYPEDQRSTRESELKESLKDLDRTIHSLSVNLLRPGWGRSGRSLNSELLEDYFNKVLRFEELEEKIQEEISMKANDLFQKMDFTDNSWKKYVRKSELLEWERNLIKFNQRDMDSIFNSSRSVPVRYFTKQGVKKIKSITKNYYKNVYKIINDQSQLLKDWDPSVIKELSPLVSDQNQLYGSVDFVENDRLVGRDERRYKMGLELVTPRIGSWADYKRANGGASANTVQGYLNKEANKTRWRFSLVLEGTELKEYSNAFLIDATAEDNPMDVTLDPEFTSKATLGVGVDVRTKNWVNLKGRFELAGSYQTFPTGSEDHHFWTYELKYTPSTKGHTRYPITLRYVDVADQLGQVDNELSANFGILYTLLPRL